MPSLRRTKGKPASKGPGKAIGKPTTPKPPRGARAKQIRTAFVMTRKGDPKLIPILLVAFLAPFALLLAIGFVIGHPIYLGVLGVLVALLVTVAIFGRRVQRTAYSQVEGQLGAAAAVLQNMRGDWRVTPAVGFTREQDLVHRVLGRPGIVLVGEGNPNRVRTLVVTEKKKLARWIGETPVYDVTVGEGEGLLGLRELERHFMKLPRNIKPVVVNELDRKLKAMPASQMPIPKGPMPTRMPRGKMR
jgi:hypothetical protein